MSNYPVKFGKYLLLERVNVGGMAEVFKAKTFGVAGFERILAIKRILPNLVEDDEFIRMFIDEARIAVQLNHTNIVQIYELGKHGEHYYIAMEYVPSRDLRAILDRMRSNGQLMPIPQAAYITKKVCEGLDYAHKKRDASGTPMNIIHRDVSPQNILVGFEGEVKVIDFGIAKAANRASKTQAGVLKGKFGYMSPEQVRGLPTDRRSDIFAVGVLLYEMLTGERLFIGESDFSTLERVRNAEVIPPTNFNKKISPALEQIVLKTLAREVEDRYQWASDLAEELDPFLIEDKQVFSMKRLAALLKETYAAEIALERQKLEDFLRITADDAKPERGPPAQSTLLPLHHPTTDPAAVASTQHPPVEPEDDAAGFGEDKTFVIEASAAGVALQNQVTDAPQEPVKSQPPQPRIGARDNGTRSNTAPKPPARPENTNDDFLEQVSLYGDDSSEVDDSRTLVSAPNPFLNGADNVKTGEEDDDDEIDASEMNDSAPPMPAPVARSTASMVTGPMSTGRQRLPTADELSDAPTAAAPALRQPSPPPRESSAMRAAAPPPRPGAAKALDPVAAAMEEEERMALEALKGTTGGRPESGAAPSAPGSSRANPRTGGVDVAGPQLPVSSYASQPPQQPFDATQEAAAVEDELVDDMPPPPAPVAAIPPQMMKLLIAAAGVSVLVFLVIVVAIAVKIAGMRSSSQLVLYTMGEVAAPPDLKVSVDDVVVPNGMGAPIALPRGVHHIRIQGSGIVPVTRVVRATGSRMRQPVLLVAADAPAHDEHEQDEKKPDEKPAEKPAEHEAASASAPPPVVSGGWRLSLAAVADDTGKPVEGADVLIDGKPYGRTPLEAEIDPALEKITVRIKKEGFVEREVPIARGGRAEVGPATVRLIAGSADKAARDEKPGDAKPVEKAADAKPADDKAPGDKAADAKPADDKAPGAKAVAADASPPAKNAAPDKAPPPEKAPQEKAAPEKAKPVEKVAEKSAPAERPKARATGQLQIGASPTCEVLIDGRRAGITPMYHAGAAMVSLGRHRVELVEKAGNRRARFEVTVSADSGDNKLVVVLGSNTFKTFGKVSATLSH